MDAWEIIVIIAAVVIVIAVVIAAVVMKRRREIAGLQERFGPEYERTMGGADDRRSRKEAQAELADRADRRDQLDIRELSPAARDRYSDAWVQVQTRFVDEPNAAVLDADNLVGQVMRERGYPVDDFDEQADMVSVDHPELVQNYRSGHRIFERAKQGRADTEQLRQGFVHYRSLFEELLGSPDTSRRDDTRELRDDDRDDIDMRDERDVDMRDDDTRDMRSEEIRPDSGRSDVAQSDRTSDTPRSQRSRR